MRGLFVTGTDVAVCKAPIACALLDQFAATGLRAVGMMPAAAGCERISTRLERADTASLVAAAYVDAREDVVNPYRLEPPVASHAAAGLAQMSISVWPGDLGCPLSWSWGCVLDALSMHPLHRKRSGTAA
jgi:dethiobiotin synthetase